MASKRRASGKRIETVDQAVQVLGGEDVVSKWLMVSKDDLGRMRRDCNVLPGYALQFFLSLTALGHKPTPALFGVRTWKLFTAPSVPAIRL